MEELFEILLENSTKLIEFLNIKYKRYFFEEIDFETRLLGIVGARGVGKTTAMLQYLKGLDLPYDKKLYVSADMVELASLSLFELAREFEKRGGRVLAIDEIHKSKAFEKELKNIYDRLQLQVIFSGSSALRLYGSYADLSRRAVLYRVQGLSFREFLELKFQNPLPKYSLDELLSDHTQIAAALLKEFRPYEFFTEYLEYGYYPFYFDQSSTYKMRLENIINTVIEVDLVSLFSIKYESLVNLKKLITFLCVSTPYKLNISELSKKVGIHRDRLYLYIDYLDKGSILAALRSKQKGDGIFLKPDKLYLQNPNLYFAYCKNPAKGTIREIFFYDQLSVHYDISYSKIGDFSIEDRYLAEVGGKSKGFEQIRDQKNSFVATDQEIGFGNKIPLWLFGFLY